MRNFFAEQYSVVNELCRVRRRGNKERGKVRRQMQHCISCTKLVSMEKKNSFDDPSSRVEWLIELKAHIAYSLPELLSAKFLFDSLVGILTDIKIDNYSLKNHELKVSHKRRWICYKRRNRSKIAERNALFRISTHHAAIRIRSAIFAELSDITNMYRILH